MKVLVLAALVAASSAFVMKSGVSSEAEKLTGEELVHYVNKVQNLFTVEHSDVSLESVKSRLMEEKFLTIDEADRAAEPIITATIPASFDARTQWSHCTSIKEIRDQATCGSCWAFGAAEAISDRICIASNGANQPEISADDVLSCCGSTCGDGCNGGYPIQAWKWWVSHGMVTGGGYGGSGCKPYPIAPCSSNCKEATTPACHSTCQTSYKTAYTADKHFGKSAYAVAHSVSAIQQEILTNGPVETAFTVYEDFYKYKSGVYTHTAGSKLGGHAVKFIGWGTENGTPYWIVANSWNTSWGEKGFFRILRGVNECGIEAAVVAGLPK